MAGKPDYGLRGFLFASGLGLATIGGVAAEGLYLVTAEHRQEKAAQSLPENCMAKTLDDIAIPGGDDGGVRMCLGGVPYLLRREKGEGGILTYSIVRSTESASLFAGGPAAH